MRRKIPSSNALLCFDAAARHKSFTRAAQELALTQSAVSRQITALEDFLGMALFVRTRHGVELSAAGQAYAPRVAQGLRTLEQDAQHVMAGLSESQEVRLASVPSFATQWLLPRLPSLARQHPGVVVHLDVRTRPFLFAGAGFDAALFAGTREQMAQWAGADGVALMAEEVIAVCSPQLLGRKRSLSASSISKLPLLQQSTRPEAWREWFETMEVDAPAALHGPRYELFSMASAAAAHGLGVALVPRLLVQSELALGSLVLAHPRGVPSGRNYYLVLPHLKSQPQAVLQFSAWLQVQAAAHG
jgi:LysR family glycine cleavage system transcriptional activator